MASVCIFVRHGYSESNKGGYLSNELGKYPLTVLGREQAAIAGDELAKIKGIRRIISSPCLRTMETAEVIAKRLGLNVEIDRRLIEADFGKFTGKTIDEICGNEKNDIATLCRKLKGGAESFSSIQNRTVEFMESLEDGTVSVAVSHAYPIATAIVYSQNLGESASFAITVDNATITIIERKEAEYRKGRQAMAYEYKPIAITAARLAEEHIAFLNSTYI